MSIESIGEDIWQKLSLSEQPTRAFLQTQLGCTPDDLTSFNEDEPVICVIGDRLRLPSVFKRGDIHLGPPSFVIFFGAKDLALYTRSEGWHPEYGDIAQLKNYGKAVFCAISPAGEINIWRSEAENRLYNMAATVFFKPPSAAADRTSITRWQDLLARVEQYNSLKAK